jgi:hypothetical protein
MLAKFNWLLCISLLGQVFLQLLRFSSVSIPLPMPHLSTADTIWSQQMTPWLNKTLKDPQFLLRPKGSPLRRHIQAYCCLTHGSPARGPPGCTVRPAATFVKRVYKKVKVKESRNRPGVAQRDPGLGSQISRHSAHEGGEVSLTNRPPLPPGNVPGTRFH